MLSPAAAAIVPGSHRTGALLPVAHVEPAVQLTQPAGDVARGSLRYVPASQRRAALAPSSQYEPEGQSMHNVLPSSPWYLPASHLAHALWPSLAVKVPGAQSV